MKQQKIKRKLCHDDNGATSILFQIIILLVIGLLLWEFGASYLGVAPLSTFLGLSEDVPEEISLSAVMVNPLVTYNPVDVLIDADSNPRDEHEDIVVYPMNEPGWVYVDHNYDVGNWEIHVSTNAPVRAFLQYNIEVKLHRVYWDHDINTKTIVDIPVSEDEFKNFDVTLVNTDVTIGAYLGFPEYTICEITLTGPLGETITSIEYAFFNEADVTT